MNEDKTSKVDGQTELVRMGGRTYRIRTQVVVEEVEGEDGEGTHEVHRRADGSFEMMLSDDDATSIDKSEQAILRTCWPAMRDALSQHLTAVSKKKPKVP
jgi:hypothetical protein